MFRANPWLPKLKKAMALCSTKPSCFTRNRFLCRHQFSPGNQFFADEAEIEPKRLTAASGPRGGIAAAEYCSRASKEGLAKIRISRSFPFSHFRLLKNVRCDGCICRPRFRFCGHMPTGPLLLASQAATPHPRRVEALFLFDLMIVERMCTRRWPWTFPQRLLPTRRPIA